MFDFALAPVEEIPPWRSNGEEKLSWFALTWGEFRLNAGDATLFESSDAIRAHWGDTEHYVTYQIASLARDILGAMGPGLAAVPEPILSYWEALDPLHSSRIRTFTSSAPGRTSASIGTTATGSSTASRCGRR